MSDDVPTVAEALKKRTKILVLERTEYVSLEFA